MRRRVVTSFVVLKDRIQKNIAKKSWMELAQSRALTLCFLCAFIGTRVVFGYCSSFHKNEGACALTLRPVHLLEDPFRFMTQWFTRIWVHSNIRHICFLSAFNVVVMQYAELEWGTPKTCVVAFSLDFISIVLGTLYVGAGDYVYPNGWHRRRLHWNWRGSSTLMYAISAALAASSSYAHWWTCAHVVFDWVWLYFIGRRLRWFRAPGFTVAMLHSISFSVGLIYGAYAQKGRKRRLHIGAGVLGLICMFICNLMPNF